MLRVRHRYSLSCISYNKWPNGLYITEVSQSAGTFDFDPGLRALVCVWREAGCVCVWRGARGGSWFVYVTEVEVV